MTLLLGALNSSAIVFAADGAEFRHAPNQLKYLDLKNRKTTEPVEKLIEKEQTEEFN